jgi:hypothetical protein
MSDDANRHRILREWIGLLGIVVGHPSLSNNYCIGVLRSAYKPNIQASLFTSAIHSISGPMGFSRS